MIKLQAVLAKPNTTNLAKLRSRIRPQQKLRNPLPKPDQQCTNKSYRNILNNLSELSGNYGPAHYQPNLRTTLTISKILQPKYDY